MSSQKASLLLGLLIMGCSVVAVVVAMGWPLKAALFPMVIGIPVFCLAAAEVAWAFFGPAPAERAMDFQLSGDLPKAVALRRTLQAAGWILAFLALIVLSGFPFAVPVFVYLYLTLQGREGRIFSLIYALVAWGFFYVLFDLLLHLPFPRGLLLDWAGF